MSEMKKRWIALYVENDVGVLAKVSGLFSGKSYNLQSLTVGTTEDETVSRIDIPGTIGLSGSISANFCAILSVFISMLIFCNKFLLSFYQFGF